MMNRTKPNRYWQNPCVYPLVLASFGCYLECQYHIKLTRYPSKPSAKRGNPTSLHNPYNTII
ncbi:hypothetical protein Hanom_Chr06g00494341 [Helianthus anomalus]